MCHGISSQLVLLTARTKIILRKIWNRKRCLRKMAMMSTKSMRIGPEIRKKSNTLITTVRRQCMYRDRKIKNIENKVFHKRALRAQGSKEIITTG